MRNQDDDRYFITDATINVWMDKDKYTQWDFEAILLPRLVRILRLHGFKMRVDPEVAKNYPGIERHYFVGHYRSSGLHVKVNQGGMRTEVKFFLEGHEYGSYGSVEKDMPYLVRKRYHWIRNILCDYLARQGYRDANESPTLDALELIRRRRREDFSGRWADTGNHEYMGTWYSYNRTDGDGRIMHEGDRRFTRDWHGMLIHGTVYYSLNSMWHLVAGNRIVTVQSCGNFFSSKEGQPRRSFPVGYRISKLNGLMAQAIKNEDFLKADLLKRLRNQIKTAVAHA